jgi:hypothetical protein
MFALAYGQALKYNFITTVVYTPKPGLFSGLFGSRFSAYEKSQIDWWMNNIGAGTFDILSVQESSDDLHLLTYAVGSNNQSLTESAIERIKPNAIKYSDIWYNTKTATVEALMDVTRTAGKVLEPLAVSLLPYILIGGVLIVGGLYLAQQTKKTVLG